MKSIAIAVMLFVASTSAFADEPTAQGSQSSRNVQAEAAAPAVAEPLLYPTAKDYLNGGYFDGNPDAAAPDPRATAPADDRKRGN